MLQKFLTNILQRTEMQHENLCFKIIDIFTKYWIFRCKEKSTRSMKKWEINIRSPCKIYANFLKYSDLN